MVYIRKIPTPLGAVTLASDGQSLTGLWFDGQKNFGSNLGPDREERDLPVFRAAEKWLEEYFTGRRPERIPPLKLTGTAFQTEVWKALRRIPYGETRSYGQLARWLSEESGKRVSARAVGAAAGRNPVSVLVPCHRLVGADGSLTGYAGGLERKKRLLELEKGSERAMTKEELKGKILAMLSEDEWEALAAGTTAAPVREGNREVLLRLKETDVPFEETVDGGAVRELERRLDEYMKRYWAEEPDAHRYVTAASLAQAFLFGMPLHPVETVNAHAVTRNGGTVYLCPYKEKEPGTVCDLCPAERAEPEKEKEERP